jgi:hypothetical protein
MTPTKASPKQKIENLTINQLANKNRKLQLKNQGK